MLAVMVEVIKGGATNPALCLIPVLWKLFAVCMHRTVHGTAKMLLKQSTHQITNEVAVCCAVPSEMYWLTGPSAPAGSCQRER